MRDCAQPDFMSPEVAAIASGRLERNTATIIAAADARPLKKAQSDHGGLGNPVENDPEHDRKPRAGCLTSSGALPVGASHAVDEDVPGEEDTAAGKEPECHGGPPIGGG